MLKDVRFTIRPRFIIRLLVAMEVDKWWTPELSTSVTHRPAQFLQSRVVPLCRFSFCNKQQTNLYYPKQCQQYTHCEVSNKTHIFRRDDGASVRLWGENRQFNQSSSKMTQIGVRIQEFITGFFTKSDIKVLHDVINPLQKCIMTSEVHHS